MKKTHTLLIIALLLLASMRLTAQVTIGSSEKPIDGALLQLKNLDESNNGKLGLSYNWATT